MAITNVWTRPQLWMPGFNPVVFSFLSDKTTEIDFSYVVDVYVGAPTLPSVGSPTLRLYQKPSPSGNCMIDVSNIVQSYLNLSNFYGTETGGAGPNYARYGNLLIPGNNLWNATASVYLIIGEQYVSGGVLTMFNGSGAAGQPGYAIYSAVGSEPARIWCGAIPYPESVANIMATSTANSFIAPYLMDGNGLFLTRLGTTQDIMSGQHHSVSFINYWDTAVGAPGTYASSVQGIEIIHYNAAGTPLSNQFIYNNTGAGGGPQTADNYTVTTFGITSAVLRFNCGTDKYPPPAGSAYYTIQAYRKNSATTSTTPGVACSSLYRFNITSPPCSDLYPVVRVAWLNDLGAMDYFNFTMLYEKSTASEYDTWFQTDLNWDGTTPYSATISGDWWLRGGPKVFSKIVTTRFVLQTDWLTQAQVDALGQIPESTLVWAYVGQNTDQPLAITITNTDYTYSNVAQQKLVQMTLECEWTKPQLKQNL